MQVNDENEDIRRNAWNELEDYANSESKQGGMLADITDTSMSHKVRSIKTWKNGTKDEYCERLECLKSYADERREQIRIAALKSFETMIVENTKPGGLLSKPELEPNLKAALSWKNGTAEEYRSALAGLMNDIEKEKERRGARKQVHDLISSEMKLGGRLTRYHNIPELIEVQNCHDGTTEFYTFELKKWTECVEEEVLRWEAMTKLHKFIKKESAVGGLLDGPEWTNDLEVLKKHQSGSTEEYVTAYDQWHQISENVHDQRKETARQNLCEFVLDNSEANGLLAGRATADILKWNNESLQKYVETLKDMQQYAGDEQRRRDAQKQLLDYVQRNRIILNELKMSFENFKIWSDGTTEDYFRELQAVASVVEAEIVRRKGMTNLLEFVAQNSQTGILDERKHREEIQQMKTWAEGHRTIDEYKNELKKWKSRVDLETERRIARGKFLDFIERNAKTDGVQSEELKKLANALDESTEFYANELTKWMITLEKVSVSFIRSD